jgi:general secretion pathway protein L
LSGRTVVIFLGQPERWLTIFNGDIVARGDGFPTIEEPARVVGVVPASDVIVHQLLLSDLTDAQARGAARLAVAENSVSPISSLHVAVSAELAGERTVVALTALHMAGYLAEFTTRGIDPDAIIAAPLILQRPGVGFTIANLGRETIIRGRDGAFADDPVLTPLLTGGEVITLDPDSVEVAIIAAAADPEVDLRQGAFARRRQWAADAQKLRRIGWLAAACFASLLILPVVDLIHLNTAARHIEAKSLVTAQSALPPGTIVTDPLAQLDERLAATGGGAGGGFLPLANAVAAAANATANVELGTLTFDSVGGLHVTAHATAISELVAFETRMNAAGLIVLPAPVVEGAGRPARDFTVRGR